MTTWEWWVSSQPVPDSEMQLTYSGYSDKWIAEAPGAIAFGDTPEEAIENLVNQ